MTRILTIFFALCVCLAGLIGAASAADNETSRQTLAGLGGVYVVVEDLQPNIVKLSDRFGFGKDQMRKDVEATLRAAGIRPLGREEWLATPGRPILYVALNTDQQGRYQWAYNIKIEVQQIASLEVNPAKKAMVATWSTNMTGVVDLGGLKGLGGQVKVLTNVFVKAFLSANSPAARPAPAR